MSAIVAKGLTKRFGEVQAAAWRARSATAPRRTLTSA